MFKRGLYTVKNYGLKRNCSISIIYPERIQLLSVDVGVTGQFRQQEGEFGIRSKVKEKNQTKTHDNVYSDNRTLRTADIKNNYNVWIVNKKRNVKKFISIHTVSQLHRSRRLCWNSWRERLRARFSECTRALLRHGSQCR